MINVLSLFSDRGTLGNYRVREPAQAVTDRRLETGVHVEATSFLGVVAGNGTISRVDVPGGINVISFQRPAKPVVPHVIAWLRQYRPDVAIVVDLDDQLPYLADEAPLKRAIALADVMTCSTQALADRYSYDDNRTFVIRNAVTSDVLENPSSALSRKRTRTDIPSERTVGWTGNALAQSADLAEMRGALGSVIGAERRDGRSVGFRSIGLRDGLSEALSVPDSLIEVTGRPLPPGLHRIALGEIDIAVVPQASLDAGATTALEFAAAGVPVIGSDTPEHKHLVAQGMPMTLVASRKRDWLRAVKALVALDDKALKDLATAHRNNVRQYHTVERRAFEWATAYRTAYQIAKELT